MSCNYCGLTQFEVRESETKKVCISVPGEVMEDVAGAARDVEKTTKARDYIEYCKQGSKNVQ